MLAFSSEIHLPADPAHNTISYGMTSGGIIALPIQGSYTVVTHRNGSEVLSAGFKEKR